MEGSLNGCCLYILNYISCTKAECMPVTEREQGAISLVMTKERTGILQDKHEQEKVKFNSTKHNKEAFRN